MRDLKRTVFVADSLHGTVQITRLERRLLGLPVINRLHDILQNSTAYLTFPCARHTRLAHSLGAMHVAGDMARCGIAYCHNSDDKALLRAVASFVSNLREREKEPLRKFVGDLEIETVLSKFHAVRFRDSLYNTVKISSLSQRDNWYFLVLWQAVRLAALLHDIGHPPFSHVTEFALDELCTQYLNGEESRSNDRVTVFRRCLKDFDAWRDGKKGKKLHEWITHCITGRVMAALRDSYEQGEPAEAQFRFFVYCATHLASAILAGEGEVGGCLHPLISSAVDCDRLDFVLRDTNTSGLLDARFNLYRLVQATRIVRVKNKLLIAFDVRAVGVMEDFLHARLYLYKYLILHHRVVKTDALLRRVVVKLAQAYLDTTDTPLVTGHRHLLPNDISGMWTALEFASSHNRYFNHLLQWVDSWLLSILRTTFFEFEEARHTRAKKKNAPNPVLDAMLGELVTNNKVYYSLVKRYDDFSRIETAVDKKCAPLFLSLQRGSQSTIGLNATRSQWGNPPCSLLRRLHDKLAINPDDRRALESSLANAVCSVCKQRGHADSFVEFRRMDAGLKDLPLILSNDAVLPLDKLSNIEAVLTDMAVKHPLFFAYVSGTRPSSDLLDNVADAVADVVAKKIAEIEKMEDKSNV